jgi:hypothetical protein
VATAFVDLPVNPADPYQVVEVCMSLAEPQDQADTGELAAEQGNDRINAHERLVQGQFNNVEAFNVMRNDFIGADIGLSEGRPPSA